MPEELPSVAQMLANAKRWREREDERIAASRAAALVEDNPKKRNPTRSRTKPGEVTRGRLRAAARKRQADLKLADPETTAVARHRIARDWTQRQLATAAGLHVRVIEDTENAVVQPSRVDQDQDQPPPGRTRRFSMAVTCRICRPAAGPGDSLLRDASPGIHPARP